MPQHQKIHYLQFYILNTNHHKLTLKGHNYKLERDGEESKVDAEMAVAAKRKRKSKPQSKQKKKVLDFPSRAYAVGDVLAAKKAFFAADTEPFDGKLPRLGKITSMRIHKPSGAFAYYIRWLDFRKVKGKPPPSIPYTADDVDKDASIGLKSATA